MSDFRIFRVVTAKLQALLTDLRRLPDKNGNVSNSAAGNLFFNADDPYGLNYIRSDTGLTLDLLRLPDINRTAPRIRVPLKPENDFDANAAIVDATVAAAPEYSRLVWPGGDGIEYKVGPVATIKKSLEIDLNGTHLLVKLAKTAGSANGQPFIRFAADYGTDLGLTTCTARSMKVTLSNPADAAGLVPGDWVTVHDAAVVPRWDGAIGYGYRYELNQIKSIAGSVVTLLVPIRWGYNVNPQITKVINPINQPYIHGAASIREVDPGVAFSGTLYGPNCPHIFAFEGCLQPKVTNCVFLGWNLHTVNFHQCLSGYTDRLRGDYPFRPQLGGHGYLVKFQYGNGGQSERSVSNGVRHHVDCTQAYDVVMAHNKAFGNVNIAYNMHGLGAQDCISMDDMCNGDYGWVSGNQSFNADYNYRIIRPKYRGTGSPIQMQTLSVGMEVIDPDIITTARPIVMTTGASGLVVRGGTLDARGSTDSGVAGVLARDKVSLSDPVGITPSTVTIKDTKILLPDNVGACVSLEVTGDVNVSAELTGGQNQIYVGANTPRDLILVGNRHLGAHQRSAQILVEPTGLQLLTDNTDSTCTNYSYGFTFNARTSYQDNDFALGPFISNYATANIDALVAAGGVLFNNTPNTLDRLPPFMARNMTLLGLTLDNSVNGNTDTTWMVGGVPRAILRMSGTGDISLLRRGLDGTLIGTWLSMDRATGTVNIENDYSKPLTLNYSQRLWQDGAGRLRTKTTAPASATDGSLLLQSGDTPSLGGVSVTGAAGTNRDITVQTNGTARHILRVSGTETGTGNAGSDLSIITRDDTGALLATAQVITRATGYVQLPTRVTVGGFSAPANPLDVYGNARLVGGVFKNAVYTRATLPSASASGNGAETFVSDPATGKGPIVYSNGTAWLYAKDDSAV